MKLEKLYEMQKALDARIIQEKGLEGQDLLPNTVLALQVELGECANEFRGFKHWSNDREPRHEKRSIAFVDGPDGGEPFEHVSYPLLEEYVDCLHFVLSIGRQIEFDVLAYDHEDLTMELVDITEAFNHSFHWAGHILFYMDRPIPNLRGTMKCYYRLLDVFLSLGKMLGFTWEQIAAAYCAKNQTNHDRQANGY